MFHVTKAVTDMAATAFKISEYIIVNGALVLPALQRGEPLSQQQCWLSGTRERGRLQRCFHLRSDEAYANS
jgi:hypothetical protein